MNKKIILTNDAPSPIGPYNQAILINNTLYISGQIPLTPKMNLIENDLNMKSSSNGNILELFSMLLRWNSLMLLKAQFI